MDRGRELNSKNAIENSQKITDWDRLTWALDFSRMRLSKKSIERLRDQLMVFMRIENENRPATIGTIDPAEFLSGPIVISCALAKPRPDEFTFNDFAELQKTFQKIINDLVDRQEYNEQAEKYGRLRYAQFKIGSGWDKAHEIANKKHPVDSGKWRGSFLQFDMKVTFTAGIWKGGNILYVDGTSHDMAILNLLSLIANQNTERIIRCPMQLEKKPHPKCKVIFIREGKRLYCSDQCSKILTQKNWRKPARKRGK